LSSYLRTSPLGVAIKGATRFSSQEKKITMVFGYFLERYRKYNSRQVVTFYHLTFSHLNPITNPTPLPNATLTIGATARNPNYWGSRVYPNYQGSCMQPLLSGLPHQP
jgi:hypothetical protein